MMNSTPDTFLAVLSQLKLLEPEQLDEIGRTLLSHYGTAPALAEELVRRGWLTPYQAEQLLKGNGASLQIGPFRILSPLGEGGMGQVFKAEQRRLGRVVALKVIHQECLSKRPDAVRRFQREARAAAQLSHPNAIVIYDADQDGDTHFIVMEYVEGLDLAQLVHNTGPLPVALACDYIGQVALGLQHAHERGMIHRDIKPSNLLVARSPLAIAKRGSSADLISLTSPAGATEAAPLSMEKLSARVLLAQDLRESGTVKILDMGLARVIQSSMEGESALTMLGKVMGTPDFIAPEQARDPHHVDGRADVYSLGCTFYFVLAGRPPFPKGGALEKLLMQQLDQPMPVEEVRPGIPTEVGDIVRKMMAKDPNKRYQSALEVNDALTQVKEIARAANVAPTSAEPKPSPSSVGVVASLAASAQAGASQPKTPQALAVMTPLQAPVPASNWESLADTPHSLAENAFEVHAPSIHWNSEPELPAALAPPATPEPAPSPSQHWRSLAEPPRSLATNPDIQFQTGLNWPSIPETPRVTPASMELAQPESLHWESAPETPCALPFHVEPETPRAIDLGKIREIAKSLESLPQIPPVEPPTPVVREPSLLAWETLRQKKTEEGTRTPDARQIALLKGHAGCVVSLTFSGCRKLLASGGIDGTVRLWDLEANEPQELAILQSQGEEVHAIAFSSDNKKLAFGTVGGRVWLWDLTEKKPRPTDVFQGYRDTITTMTYSPDNKLLAFGGAGRTVRVFDVSTEEPRSWAELSGHTGSITAVLIAPDGKRFISASQDGTVRLWTPHRFWNKRQAVLQASHCAVNTLSIAPDGRSLAMGSPDQTFQLWDISTDAPQRQNRISDNRGGIRLVLFPAVTNSLVTVEDQGRASIWDLATYSRREEWLVPFVKAYTFALTFDGRYLATGNTDGSVFVHRIATKRE